MTTSFKCSTFSMDDSKSAYLNSLNSMTWSKFKNNAYINNGMVIDAMQKNGYSCWAATSANMLAWTGWCNYLSGVTGNADPEQFIYQYYMKNTAVLQGYWEYNAIQWFFDGSYTTNGYSNIWKPSGVGNEVRCSATQYLHYEQFSACNALTTM